MKAAQARVEAIELGETVEGGLAKPQDLRAILKAIGWTKADQRHADLLAVLAENDICAGRSLGENYVRQYS